MGMPSCDFFTTGSVTGLLTLHHHSADSCCHTQATANWHSLVRRVTVSVYVYTCACPCVLVCAYVGSCVWVCTHVCTCVCGSRMALALLCLPSCLLVICLPVKITALTVHCGLTNVCNANDAWHPFRTASKYHKGHDNHYLEQGAWMHLLMSAAHQRCWIF